MRGHTSSETVPSMWMQSTLVQQGPGVTNLGIACLPSALTLTLAVPTYP
jgi:hypothetical protein